MQYFKFKISHMPRSRKPLGLSGRNHSFSKLFCPKSFVSSCDPPPPPRSRTISLEVGAMPTSCKRGEQCVLPDKIHFLLYPRRYPSHYSSDGKYELIWSRRDTLSIICSTATSINVSIFSSAFAGDTLPIRTSLLPV